MSTPTQRRALLPFPLVSGNIEGLHARHRRSTRIIYLTVLFALLAGAVALPFIHVDVSSSARGVLRPERQRTPVTTPLAGRVLHSRLVENRNVCAGDTLLVLSTADLRTEREALNDQITERQLLLADLDQLTGAPDQPQLQTAVYQRDFRDFQQQRAEARLRLLHAERHYERQAQLHETQTIARMDFEQAQFERDLARRQVQGMADQRARAWSQEKQRIRRELQEFRNRRRTLDERSANYLITASVDGTLTETQSLPTGSWANPGQALAVISPDGELHVETYVSPTDIGLLRVGQEVQLQFDAFNSHQWGLGYATVTDIAQDARSAPDNTAHFPVTLHLRYAALRLPNGYEGRLRKGMTLTAHFTLARRSLFDLLHDRVDDWFTPNA